MSNEKAHHKKDNQRAAKAGASRVLTADRVTRVLGRAVVVGLISVAIGFLFLAPSEGMGTFGQPGPGLWPFIAAAGTTFVGLIALILGGPWQHDGGPSAYRGPATLVITFLATYLLLIYVNGLVAVAIASFVLTKFIGRSSWLKALVVAVCVAAGIYLTFNFLLGVPPIR